MTAATAGADRCPRRLAWTQSVRLATIDRPGTSCMFVQTLRATVCNACPLERNLMRPISSPCWPWPACVHTAADPCTAKRRAPSTIRQPDRVAARRRQHPGLSLAVVADGAVVFARGFGLADIEYGIAATPDTPYNIASVTKPISATVALRLVEQARSRSTRRWPDTPTGRTSARVRQHPRFSRRPEVRSAVAHACATC